MNAQQWTERRRQDRYEARLARAETALERHQIEKGEGLVNLADRLGISRNAIFRLAGRGGSYVRRSDDAFRMDSTLIAVVSADTGIPMGQLFEEAAMAACKRAAE